MDSIIPEPVIMDFPIESSPVADTNVTQLNTKYSDSTVDEHVVQYSVQHPTHSASIPGFNVHKNYSVDNTILGLIPPAKSIATNNIKKQKKFKKPRVKKILKKVKVDEELSDSNLFDVFGPITSLFTNDDDVRSAPIVHNFYNIKMAPLAKFKTTTLVENDTGKNINRFQTQNFKRTKRNMKGVDLQKPKERKLNFITDSNVTLSSPTARIRMYSPKNGTWFREKREHISVNVDVRRKEPRYYYHTERPRARVKRVVHNPPFYSRIGEVFSSKYLVSDQEKSETLPEEINVAFSTTPKYQYPTTPKFIPAIAFGDSKTKIIKYNDSVANSTNGIGTEHGISTNGIGTDGITQLDKKESLIYVINPDTGHGKWMQVIKVKNEGDTKYSFSNGPVYLEKKVPVIESYVKNSNLKDSHTKASHDKNTFGKFGFKGSTRDLFKSALGPIIDHRFNVKIPSTRKEVTKKDETKAQLKKADCPNVILPKKKEVCFMT